MGASTRIALLALAAALTGTPAFAQPAPSSPADFAADAAGADGYEVMAGRIALTESRDPAIRAFAEAMVRDHAAAAERIRQAAAASGLEPPTEGVGSEQRLLLAGLQSLRGPELDRTYVHQQVLAHKAAQAIEGGYARDGADANLKRAAQADVPMIAHHLDMAAALDHPAT